MTHYAQGCVFVLRSGSCILLSSGTGCSCPATWHKDKTIYPSIFITSSAQGHGGPLEPPPAVIGEGEVTPRRSRWFFTMPHRKSKTNCTQAYTCTQIVSFHLRHIGRHVTSRQVSSWQENECDSGSGRGEKTPRWRSWLKKTWLSRQTGS